MVSEDEAEARTDSLSRVPDDLKEDLVKVTYILFYRENSKPTRVRKTPTVRWFDYEMSGLLYKRRGCFFLGNSLYQNSALPFGVLVECKASHPSS